MTEFKKEVDTFNSILEKAIALLISKGNDYNHGIERKQYFPFGNTSYITIIYIKALRLVSLEKNRLAKKETHGTRA